MRGVVPSGSTLVVITVAPLLLACVDFEPTDAAGPPEPAREPAGLSAQLRLSTGKPIRAGAWGVLGSSFPQRGEVGRGAAEERQSTVVLNAFFFPGRDSRGTIRTVTRDTIDVLDRKIDGVEGGPIGTLLFSDGWTFDLDDVERAARLRAPNVQGRARPPPTLEFGLCRGEGPYDMMISRDDTMRFEISCQNPPEPADQGFWELTFRSWENGRSVFALGGAPSPASTVPIPALVLDHADQSDLIATLRVIEAWQASDDDYDVSLTVTSESSWTVRWK